MNATIAARMTSADFLKLRKKRVTVICSALLTIAPIVIYFIVSVAQHASNPGEHGPAGGTHAFVDTIRVLSFFLGPLGAILIGAEAGAGDSAAGVFRDLVVTGRSRLALFATRVPAALAFSWLIMTCGFLVAVAGTYAFASSEPTPDGALLANGYGFTLLTTSVVCAVAVGFASLTASRPAALTTLIGWQLVASPLIAMISSLGHSRDFILSQALAHYSPVHLGDRRGAQVTMGSATAIAILALWLAVFLALGAWRTRTMDA